MPLWRGGSCSLASLLLTPVSPSIIRFWFINKSLFLRIPASNAISFTIRIILSRHASLAGPRAIALFRIKKIGTLSVATCAFIKFTPNGCSKTDSLSGEHRCQTLHRRPNRRRRLRGRRLNLCRQTRRRFRRWADDEAPDLISSRETKIATPGRPARPRPLRCDQRPSLPNTEDH
jgi:hypothetical protein